MIRCGSEGVADDGVEVLLLIAMGCVVVAALIQLATGAGGWRPVQVVLILAAVTVGAVVIRSRTNK